MPNTGKRSYGNDYIQGVSSQTGGLKGELTRFKGVATTYLPSLLGRHGR
jgi:hypothetical protein